VESDFKLDTLQSKLSTLGWQAARSWQWWLVGWWL